MSLVKLWNQEIVDTKHSMPSLTEATQISDELYLFKNELGDMGFIAGNPELAWTAVFVSDEDLAVLKNLL